MPLATFSHFHSFTIRVAYFFTQRHVMWSTPPTRDFFCGSLSCLAAFSCGNLSAAFWIMIAQPSCQPEYKWSALSFSRTLNLVRCVFFFLFWQTGRMKSGNRQTNQVSSFICFAGAFYGCFSSSFTLVVFTISVTFKFFVCIISFFLNYWWFLGNVSLPPT